MPTDRSMTQPDSGVKDTADRSQPKLKKPRLPKLKKRRLGVDDVNVVDAPMLKKALGGTVVGNTMEWYDVGVFDT